MAKIPFSKFDFKNKNNKKIVKINGQDLEIKTYLPIQEKVDFVNYVLNNAIDEESQTFSPIRLQVYFDMALILFYTNIKFSEGQIKDFFKTYDICEQNNLFEIIISTLADASEDDKINEYTEMYRYVNETAQDISRYNNSLIGIMKNLSNETFLLNEDLQKMLESIKNKEGLEQLAVIKDIVGRD